MKTVRAMVITTLMSVVVSAYAVLPYSPKAPICEGLSNPTNVTDYSPEFGWIFTNRNTSDTQSAYQILVGFDLEDLEINKADMWDSGKIERSISKGIVYRGKAISSNQSYY